MRPQVNLFNVVGSAEIASVPVDLVDARGIAIQVGFTPSGEASSAGTLKLQGSNAPDTLGWVDIANSSQAVAAGVGHLWNVTDCEYRYIRVYWTPTAAVTGKTWSNAQEKTSIAYASAGAGPYVVTVTSNTHGLASLDTIAVNNGSDADVNGLRVITKTGANTFTFATVADPGASGTLDYSKDGYKITVASATHGLATGMKIVSSSAGTPELDGTQTITKTDAGNFTLKVTTNPSDASGTDFAYNTYGTMVAVTAQKEPMNRQ